MSAADLFWVFLGGVLYGLLMLLGGVVLDWFWNRRRRGALPDDYDDWKDEP